MKVTLISASSAPLGVITAAARVTRGKPPTQDLPSDPELVKRLMVLGHDSVLEFAWFCFYIEGISRACLAQLTRHRLFSFCVESQRHSIVDKDYIVPESIVNAGKEEEYRLLMDAVFDFYRRLIDEGVPVEDARYVLPNATKVKLFVAGNLRAWRHFISLRSSPEAQWEIRELARRVYEELGKLEDIFIYQLGGRYETCAQT